MKVNRRTALAGFAGLSIAPAVPTDDYPGKPVETIVSFAAYVKAETKWWTRSIKAAGIEAE